MIKVAVGKEDMAGPQGNRFQPGYDKAGIFPRIDKAAIGDGISSGVSGAAGKNYPAVDP
jgi:hypothetical protein